ncbi:MAG: preprotein translocase subunit SecG [Crocinitomicaceae bacterium]|jgi:preprotein translocase subunit SecG|nr:preprotein translocase subunit SecG [Crocinitomicaceae bacterium]
MSALLSIIIILASILLIIVVFIQNPKGGGLSSDFGGATQIGGVQKTNDFIDKATWVLAVTIVVVSIVLTIQSTPKKVNVPQATEQQQGPQNGAPQQ